MRSVQFLSGRIRLCSTRCCIGRNMRDCRICSWGNRFSIQGPFSRRSRCYGRTSGHGTASRTGFSYAGLSYRHCIWPATLVSLNRTELCLEEEMRRRRRFWRHPSKSAVPFGRSPLNHAARKGHEAVLRLLLDRRADANAKDNDGSTAWFLARMQTNKQSLPFERSEYSVSNSLLIYVYSALS